MTATTAGLGFGTYFGTEVRGGTDGEPARTFEERRGRCYELAGAALLLGRAPSDAVLVHGSIDGHLPDGPGRIGHAWLRLTAAGDETVWEPITGEFYDAAAWEEFSDPRVEAEYTRHEAFEVAASTENWGPWHDEVVTQ